MRLIVAIVLCLAAFIGTSRSMPVAENALASSPQPSSPSTQTTEDESLLVVPSQKEVEPTSVAAAVKKITGDSVESQEHQAGESSARSSESIATIPEVDDKAASEIANSAEPVNDAVARSDEASQSLPEKKSVVEVSGESSVPQTEIHATSEIGGTNADATSFLLDSHESLVARAKSSSEVASKLVETISPAANEGEISAKSASTKSKESEAAASLSEESSEKQRRVAAPAVAQSNEPNKVEEKEVKKETEASIEKTDRVTREAEEAAAAAAKASLAPSEAAPAIPSSTVPAAELSPAVPEAHSAGAPKIEASLAEIEKPQEPTAATPKIGGQSESIDSPRATSSAEKENSPKVGEQVEKEVEKKSVTSENPTPVDKLAAEPASGHAASEKREIEEASASSSDMTVVPQAKSEIVEPAAAEATVKTISDDAASPAEVDSAKSEQSEPAGSANADTIVRAVNDIEKSSEDQVTVTAASNKKEDSTSTIEAKSSLSPDTVEKTTKSVAPEEIKAEELPKPQEVTAIKESSEKRNATSKENSESSESSESDEASGDKRVEHSE